MLLHFSLLSDKVYKEPRLYILNAKLNVVVLSHQIFEENHTIFKQVFFVCFFNNGQT